MSLLLITLACKCFASYYCNHLRAYLTELQQCTLFIHPSSFCLHLLYNYRYKSLDYLNNYQCQFSNFTVVCIWADSLFSNLLYHEKAQEK